MFNSIARFLRQQAVYLSLAAILVAIFWAIGLKINPATAVIYSLCFGNLATPPMERVRRMVSGRQFPYDWLIFLSILLILTPVIYVLSSVVVIFTAPPSPQSLGHLIRTGWKLPFVVIFLYSAISFLYLQTKERLERRNNELLRTVEFSTAQLEMQEQDLQRAREIQQSLLPKEILQIPGFEIAAAWQPARVVSGDYFDVLKLDENRLGICIADVVGKGVAAALLMANVQATVRAFARDSESPAQLCNRVNSVLCGNIDSGKFVTFFYGVLNGEQHTLDYCNAGHPQPILISENSSLHLPSDGAVLGVFPAWKYTNLKVRLNSGDRLLLFTDGMTEVTGADGQEFGEQNLAATAEANRASSASTMNRSVFARVTEYSLGHFQDDATLMVIASR